MPARRKHALRSTYRKSYKRKNRLSRLFKAFSLSLTGLVLFSAAFYIYAFSLTIFKPFVKASDGMSFSNTGYNSNTPSTFLFIKIEDVQNPNSKIENLTVYKLYASEKKSIIINIDVQANAETDSDLKIKDLYALKNYGQNPKSTDTVCDFVKSKLAINIDYYFVYDTEFVNKLTELGIKIDSSDIPSSLGFKNVTKIPEIIKFASSHTLTNLNGIDTLKIINDTKTLNKKSFKILSISKFDTQNLKNFDENIIKELSVREQKDYRDSIIVLNSTSTLGLASFGARISKNTGGIVLETQNLENEFKESAIYTSKKDSKLVSYISKTLKIKKIYDTNEFLDNLFLASRADILLVMGLDVSENFK